MHAWKKERYEELKYFVMFFTLNKPKIQSNFRVGQWIEVKDEKKIEGYIFSSTNNSSVSSLLLLNNLKSTCRRFIRSQC